MKKDFLKIINKSLNRKSTPVSIIRAFRTNLNLTQKQLEDMTGIKENNISALESERMDISLKVAEKLAAAMGIRPEYILFPKGRKTPKKIKRCCTPF